MVDVASGQHAPVVAVTSLALGGEASLGATSPKVLAALEKSFQTLYENALTRRLLKHRIRPVPKSAGDFMTQAGFTEFEAGMDYARLPRKQREKLHAFVLANISGRSYLDPRMTQLKSGTLSEADQIILKDDLLAQISSKKSEIEVWKKKLTEAESLGAQKDDAKANTQIAIQRLELEVKRTEDFVKQWNRSPAAAKKLAPLSTEFDIQERDKRSFEKVAARINYDAALDAERILASVEQNEKLAQASSLKRQIRPL